MHIERLYDHIFHVVQFQKSDCSLIKAFLKKLWNILDNGKNK